MNWIAGHCFDDCDRSHYCHGDIVAVDAAAGNDTIAAAAAAVADCSATNIHYPA